MANPDGATPAGGPAQGRRAADRGRYGRLSRQRVLASALEIVDRDGLSALSMRRLGGNWASRRWPCTATPRARTPCSTGWSRRSCRSWRTTSGVARAAGIPGRRGAGGGEGRAADGGGERVSQGERTAAAGTGGGRSCTASRWPPTGWRCATPTWCPCWRPGCCPRRWPPPGGRAAARRPDPRPARRGGARRPPGPAGAPGVHRVAARLPDRGTAGGGRRPAGAGSGLPHRSAPHLRPGPAPSARPRPGLAEPGGTGPLAEGLDALLDRFA